MPVYGTSQSALGATDRQPAPRLGARELAYHRRADPLGVVVRVQRAVDGDGECDARERGLREHRVQLTPLERRQHVRAEHQQGDAQLLQLRRTQLREQRRRPPHAPRQHQPVDLQRAQPGVVVQARGLLGT